MNMKYLVFACPSTSLERIYLFPATEQHKDFAAHFTTRYWKPIRGGFVMLVDQEASKHALVGMKCYGESISLGLQSDSEKDLALLLKQLSA